MLSRITIIAVVGTVLSGIAVGAVPIAGHIAPGPGIDNPIFVDGDPETDDGEPVHYGYGSFLSATSENPGPWTITAGGTASLSTATAAGATLYATLADPEEGSGAGAITVMSDTVDWVCEIRHRIIGMTGSQNDTAWVLKRYLPGIDPDDMPMFGLSKTDPNSDQWKISGGGNYQTNRYPTLVSGLTLGDGVWHTYTMHYRAAEHLMDFYMDGVLLVSDVARTDGYYGANRLQIETMRTASSTTEVDYVILGQLVPDEALTGDANLDGIVDAQDFTILKGRYGFEGGWSDGDANRDRLVDAQDFTYLKTNYGQTWGSGSMATPTPEPTTLALLTLGGFLTVRRKK